MKPGKHVSAILSAGLLALSGVSALADAPQMKMTTDLPASITTPDSVDSSLGTLTYRDGVPDGASVETLYEYLDRSRAVEVMLNAMPTMSAYALREGQRAAGCAAAHQICIVDTLLDSKGLFLTGNTSTMYSFGFLDLERDGPTVVDIPPGMLGVLDDMAFQYITDLGAAGPDKGKGGKYLVLPPGYDGDVPDGYFVFQSKTYGVWNFMRGYLTDGVAAASKNIRDNLKVYPLSQADTPPEMEFVNITGKEMNTIVATDVSFYAGLNDVIQQEPEGFLGVERTGQLAAIGIEKGKDFAPDDRMQAILEDAAKIGDGIARAYTYFPRDPGVQVFGADSAWVLAYPDRNTFFMRGEGRNLDGRTTYHYGYIVVSPAMAIRAAGKGSDYTMAMLDSEKRPLDGAKTYKLTMPADVPVKDFWAVTMYDTQTRSQLQTDQQFPTLDSYTEGMQKNADGSIDVYFGPTPPEGKESNWLQSVPGKGWFIALRMYGPLEPWLDGSWQPGEIELVE
ncbi:DUF1254 domain-containing protein [Ruegeria atlantica]|uniref:DUF1254 domain-containing protein n=1 Tax=Ruegeria atlantica TaxID=81569 RepID=A0A0P1EZW2_9RHOB|nr:DUF1254 domain-containing protein [Ruegeria atlantica]CUH46477.1 hypothetical protein RUA4292_00643 [Ruegeria atlantica]